MKRTTLIIIMITGTGLAYLAPRMLHATPTTMSFQEAMQEGILLGNTIITTNQANSWLDRFMWRFTALTPRVQRVVKAYASKQVGEYFLKQSHTLMAEIEIENRQPNREPDSRPIPMHIE